MHTRPLKYVVFEKVYWIISAEFTLQYTSYVLPPFVNKAKYIALKYGNFASDQDESDVEELPEVDISVLSVQPYMFEPTKSSENGTVESESESEDESSNRFY